MAVPVLLYGSETWTPRKRDWNRIKAAEMKYLRTVIGCTRLDQIRNESGISLLSEKITEYRNKWKAHLQRMEHTRILLRAYKYQPSGKRDIARPRRRWRETQQYQRPEQEILLIHEVMMMRCWCVTTELFLYWSHQDLKQHALLDSV
jgi:hypothetical protein